MRKLSLLLLVVMMSASCSTKKRTPQINRNAELQGVQWNAVYIRVDDSTAFHNANPLPFLVFTSDSTFSGNTGCNNFMGSYKTFEGGRISLLAGPMTMMMCEDIETEWIYLEQIRLTEHYLVSGDSLTFMDFNKTPQIIFTKTKLQE